MRHVVILLGPPGVGKGTVSQTFMARFGFRWLSTGELLRAVKKSGSDLARQIGKLIDAGKFAPDELVIDLLERELKAFPADCCLLLDGFPRTLPQAEALNGVLERCGATLTLVVSLDADESELERRIMKRAEEQGRSDDSLATFRHRMQVFRDRTAPLMDYFAARDDLMSADGVGTPDEVADRISQLIQKRLPADQFPSGNQVG